MKPMKWMALLVLVLPAAGMALSFRRTRAARRLCTGALYVCGVYQGCLHLLAVLFALMALFGTVTDAPGRKALTGLLAACVVLVETCALAASRFRLVFDDETLHVTPCFGRPVTLRFSQLSRAQETCRRGLLLYENERPVCTVPLACTGYREFRQALQAHGLL